MSSSSSALAKGKSAIGSAAGSAKFEAKGKFSSSSSPAAAATKRGTTTSSSRGRGRGKADKKVYSLPGQKFDPPEEREPLRIFYESLSKQIPSSEMAEFWLMEHGMLSPERARKAYERKQKRQQQVRMGTPIKSCAVRKDNKPESSKKPGIMDSKAKRRVDYSDDDDDDFIVKMKRSRG
ncbi:uncharacterized protein LOC100276253 [Zea mays]|uniref:Uncharacterized protein n=1 Tax=Zea mays TaxID=4577 RepID=B6T7I9_MAIZE|nr:uncharacterized protein LOC100276253 [Zea mays]ACG33072.1 hypothetical protein [Zea mays]|eukprot:NP_001143557.1 uncharacterized protein LOC100276253 [Zea mays]